MLLAVVVMMEWHVIDSWSVRDGRDSTVFAWITSYLLLGEVLSRRAVLGAALILGGILMVELKPFRFGPHLS